MRHFYLVAAVFCMLLSLAGCQRPDAGVVATLDAVHPATEVYYRGILLGTTPLKITEEMCQELNFVVPNEDLISDGYGEGIAFGVEDRDETKVMFLVPEEFRQRYLTIETPWGPRTKLGGSSGHHRDEPVRMTSRFMNLTDDDGIRLELQPLESEYRPGQRFEIELLLSATAGELVEGYRPEVEAFWGTFDTPWRHRSTQKFALDDKFRKIKLGDKHAISFELEAPSVAGDYSLFVLFHLFEHETGSSLSIGAVYSESRLIRVRR